MTGSPTSVVDEQQLWFDYFMARMKTHQDWCVTRMNRRLKKLARMLDIHLSK